MSWKRDQRSASTLSSARALPERLLRIEPHAPRFSVVDRDPSNTLKVLHSEGFTSTVSD